MRWTRKSELGRKLIHLSSILLIFLYNIIDKYYDKTIALFSLTVVLIGALIYEYLRLRLKMKLPLSEFARFREKNKHTGLIYSVSGIVISFAVFDYNVALAAVLMGIFGDLVVGLLHGFRNDVFIGRKRRNASELIVEFIVNFTVGIIVLHNVFIVLMMAMVATAIEAMFENEDNLAIPLFSGFFGQILFWLIK